MVSGVASLYHHNGANYACHCEPCNQVNEMQTLVCLEKTTNNSQTKRFIYYIIGPFVNIHRA